MLCIFQYLQNCKKKKKNSKQFHRSVYLKLIKKCAGTHLMLTDLETSNTDMYSGLAMSSIYHCNNATRSPTQGAPSAMRHL